MLVGLVAGDLGNSSDFASEAEAAARSTDSETLLSDLEVLTSSISWSGSVLSDMLHQKCVK